jgi:hypothetical protein
MPTDAAGRRQAITELATNIILHIKAAAEQVVGRTRVIPGRCQPWMDQELRAAIKLRRELFAALKDACADGQEGEVDAADLAYTQQRKQVRKLVKAKMVALARALDAAINRAWRKRVSERSVLGEKEIWRLLHSKLGRTANKTTVQAVCNPATNCVEVSDAGIAEAFAQHSCNIGSSAGFARDTAAGCRQFVHAISMPWCGAGCIIGIQSWAGPGGVQRPAGTASATEAQATQLLASVGLDAEALLASVGLDGGQQQALQQEAAEVVAGALGVQQEQVGMMWMGGSQKLPQDTEYRYLGVQLSTDCGWKKHAEVLKDKCLRMKGMLEGVFRNKCLDSM